MLRGGRWALLAPAAMAAIALIAACADPFEATDDASAAESTLDKADWLEKASRVLRGGDGLGPRDDFDALMKTPREEIVDQWMRDRRFGDSVLAFNLYYLGRAIDRVKTNAPTGGYKYDPIVFQFPQALAAAQAVVTGGNYFDLFSARPPIFRTVNGGGSASDRAQVVGALDAAITLTTTDRTQGCNRFSSGVSQAVTKLSPRGFQPPVTLGAWARSNAAYPQTIDCRATTTMPTEALLASMHKVRDVVDGVFAQLEARPVPSQLWSVTDIPPIHAAADGFPALAPPLSKQFFANLPSTSTNNQRKRAAFMLKTYFCDDLTPLSVPAPDPDAGPGDVHASNPACQACHYRLDPMGALFRNFGKNGDDFTGQTRIIFDDNITFTDAAKEQYLAQWKNPDGSFRAGYWVLGRDGKPMREPGWTNADGDTMDGLFSYLPRSKVVKACLVRRLAEYVLGPKQIYDREWLNEISRGFQNGPASGEAFKSVVKSLVLSRTFQTHDPRPGSCYDAPADAPPNRSPCAVAYVVNTHCTGCHNSPKGPGNLDLTDWRDVGGGVFSWTHTDDEGRQLPREESLRRIRFRITTTDREKKMPLARTMPEGDVTQFTEWLDTTLEGTR